MQRRDLLKSGAFLTGGLAAAALPKPAHASSTQFNSNIAKAFFTAFNTLITAYSQGKVTASQAENVASTFATFIAEMQSTGLVAQSQAYINANSAQIAATKTIDPNTVLSLAEKLGPFTYADAQAFAETYNTNYTLVQQALLAPNGFWTCLQSVESAFQAIASYISSVGGVLSVAGTPGQGHLEKVFRCVALVYAAIGIGLIGIFAPEAYFIWGYYAYSSGQILSGVGLGITGLGVAWGC